LLAKPIQDLLMLAENERVDGQFQGMRHALNDPEVLAPNEGIL
jgi:hypothetical protein